MPPYLSSSHFILLAQESFTVAAACNAFAPTLLSHQGHVTAIMLLAVHVQQLVLCQFHLHQEPV